MKYLPKYIEQLTDFSKVYSVASFWIIIATLKNEFNFKFSYLL